MNRFSVSNPAFTKKSRWADTEEWDIPDLRVISEMFSSLLSSTTPMTLIRPLDEKSFSTSNIGDHAPQFVYQLLRGDHGEPYHGRAPPQTLP